MQHTVTATGMVPATPIAIPIPRELTPLLPLERTCEVDIFVFSDSKRRNANNQKHVTRNGIIKCVSYWWKIHSRFHIQQKIKSNSLEI